MPIWRTCATYGLALTWFLWQQATPLTCIHDATGTHCATGSTTIIDKYNNWTFLDAFDTKDLCEYAQRLRKEDTARHEVERQHEAQGRPYMSTHLLYKCLPAGLHPWDVG